MRVIVYVRCIDSFFFQAEDGIRDLVRSRGLGDVYKRQVDFLVVVLVIIANHSVVPEVPPSLQIPLDAKDVPLSLIHI